METIEWDKEYSKAVAEFLGAAHWIGPIDRPLAVQLRALAHSLDQAMSADGAVVPAAASQFAQTWARLAKRDPAASKAGKDDGLDGWLTPIPGLENGLAHGAGCQCPGCAGAA